ncbi:MAG: B12-binding domain-containing radical SAM protein [Anaerolineae bacterium]
MRVLMVYPEFPDTFWSFKHALGFVRKKASAPPLGLITVAAMLPRDWSVRLVDMNVRSLASNDIAWADMVFISAMTVQRQSARAVIARCKEMGVKVVAGGPLFTSEHEDFPEVDHLVLNEAELTLPPFLEDLARGTPQRLYRTDAFADIRQTPAPRWELLDLPHYATMSVQFSRGCPFNCDFCNVTALLGHKVRTKTAEQIIAELDALYALGWRDGVFFVDDNFIGNKRQLKRDVLPALIEWRKDKVGLPFTTEVSINLADDEELVNLMTQAGFESVFVGIETPNEASLNECGKHQNRHRDLLAAVKRLQRAGLAVMGGFIVGFDSDTPSVFQQQIDFIQQSGIVAAMVGLLQAPVGTRLYERLKQEGRLLTKMSGDNVDGSINFIPRMSLETLREGYRSILTHIYAPEHYYARVRTFLSEYQPRSAKSRIGIEHILGFLRTIYRLGIREAERVYYWRLFFWTLVHRPRLFPTAITLAVYGYHFRRICQAVTGTSCR